MSALAVYNYTYGQGAEPNRQIQFFRGYDARSIRAQVFSLTNGEIGELISDIPGNRISIEGQSLVQRTHNYLLRRDPLFEDETFAQLTTEQQNAVLQSIQRRSRTIEVENGLGSRKYERILRLSISALR